MLRSLVISFFMTGSAMSLIPAEKPPSSLSPSKTGVVTLTHVSQRTVGCVGKGKGKDLKCSPELAPSDASAAIVLRPIRSAEVGDKDRRQPVSVSLPQTSTPTGVPLAPGVWELDWTARNEHDRFFVAAGDEFAITLSTQAGSCKKQKDECVLTTESTTQKVTIPKECRR